MTILKMKNPMIYPRNGQEKTSILEIKIRKNSYLR